MKNIQLKKALQTAGGIGLGLALITLFFSSAKSDIGRRCTGMKIHLADNSRQLIVQEADIKNWATLEGKEQFDGTPVQNINLSKIERRVLGNGNIKEVDAFVDLNGKLILNAEAYKPVARIMANHSFPNRYMDIDGHFFPILPNHTPTLLLVSGDYFNTRKGLESEKNSDLLAFIQRIVEDDFWNAQITQINVNSNKEISIVPLMGNHIIEFGKPVNVESKLKKLMIFYEKIMPQEKWSNFTTVSVKYDGQIVCG